ncbi:DUF4317 domain-containing protein [Porcincola intestinalis]|jgi:hypothetical protein|uniref:DUF4317 domain-containing protein n=2 Tax=Porcincola intestinalis TaxID=2606632 RepID=A0A6L5X6B4_9FIRM|nr:DUF4317 domain-containing protein [Porcincola intestinalis]MCI6766655.1 DUF4317 domain-containing protein [Lachnospiraceae bacterium]MDD7060937.1 DUF4317 domain-containing protein [Porcincola intestinalis]MDY5283368.1 DUF4317 domain-containing protein [Porcincola intestinalis]MSS13912.1 DUF4317 domain-containing protein [Porcincola intestinalis]
MNKKEISEIKKQLTVQKNTFTRIAGCYVSAEKEKITTFSQMFQRLEEEEMFKYFEIFRKTLSGTLGKNLINMDFPMESEEEDGTQAFLYRLAKSELEDEELLDAFYNKVIESYTTGENYLILLLYNNYDVPGKTTDEIEMLDASSSVFSYFQCAICPVDLSKPALSYAPAEQVFKNRERDWVVAMPEVGFMFPAFNDRAADIHHTLYYSKDSEDLHFDLTDKLLGCQAPLSAGLQKEAFQTVVEETLGRDCSFETVRNLHDSLQEIQQQAKDADSPDPVSLDKVTMRNLLEKSGASPEDMHTFDQSFEENAGEKGTLMLSNVCSSRKFEVHTPDVTVTVSPDRTDLVRTQIIDGRECLVIPISDDVQVNGITVKHLTPGADGQKGE